MFAIFFIAWINSKLAFQQKKYIKNIYHELQIFRPSAFKDTTVIRLKNLKVEVINFPI